MPIVELAQAVMTSSSKFGWKHKCQIQKFQLNHKSQNLPVKVFNILRIAEVLVDCRLVPFSGHFTPLLAERVTQTLKFMGQLPKKTTEMQQVPHQSQAEILGLLLGGHSIQNRTRISSRNEKYLT